MKTIYSGFVNHVIPNNNMNVVNYGNVKTPLR